MKWWALATMVLLAACSPKRSTVSLTLNQRVTTAGGAGDSVSAAANDYLKYLDQLRRENEDIAKGEQRKFDIMSVSGIALGTTSAIFGFLNNDDKKKARVAGIAGAGSALLTALIAKFRHGEDAQQARTCTKQLERTAVTFRFPATMQEFIARRDTISGRLDQLDCLAASVR